MDEEAEQVFRLDNEVLAFRFTATLSHRYSGTPRERLTSPDRLRLWLAAASLDPERDVTDRELALALTLREAIYRVGHSVACGDDWRAADIEVLNTAVKAGRAVPVLTSAGRHWSLSEDDPVRGGLAVIAADAIETIGTGDTGRIKICEGQDCHGLYLDSSRGNNRRWCSMNTCGNKAKKARMNTR